MRVPPTAPCARSTRRGLRLPRWRCAAPRTRGGPGPPANAFSSSGLIPPSEPTTTDHVTGGGQPEPGDLHLRVREHQPRGWRGEQLGHPCRARQSTDLGTQALLAPLWAASRRWRPTWRGALGLVAAPHLWLFREAARRHYVVCSRPRLRLHRAAGPLPLGNRAGRTVKDGSWSAPRSSASSTPAPRASVSVPGRPRWWPGSGPSSVRTMRSAASAAVVRRRRDGPRHR